MIVMCPHCKVKVAIDDGKIKPEGIKVRCGRCNNIFAVKKKIPAQQVPAGAKKVLIAHESEVFRKSIRDIIAKDGYEIYDAQDGAVALQIIEEKLPDAAIIDVMLPKMFGFEIADLVKRSEKLKSVKIILIGDVYDKTRLRREPQSYYGADGYIEKPNVLKDISHTLKNVLGIKQVTPVPKAVPKQSPVPVQERPSVEEKKIVEEVPPSISEEERAEHEKARRLAKLIVSDIALYNPKLVEEGIKNNTFYHVLDKDIKQAYKLFSERVPEHVRSKTDYLKQAFEEFIANKKKQLQ